MSPSSARLPSGVRSTLQGLVLLSVWTASLSYRHFVLVSERKSWQEARQHCRERHHNMAAVDNAEEARLLLEAAGGYRGDVWLGLRDRPGRWRWTLDREGHVNYPDLKLWRTGGPDDRSAQQLCATYWEDTWSGSDCYTNYPFVCYNNNNNNNSDSSATSPNPYVFVDQSLSWFQARTHCRRHHTELAGVRTQTERALLRQVVPPQVRASIGLFRHVFSDWGGAGDAPFRNWKAGHPGNGTSSCVMSDTTDGGRWEERPCKEERYFMCYDYARYLFHFKVTALKSSIDLNHPRVADAILNLIKENVENKEEIKGLMSAWIHTLH